MNTGSPMTALYIEPPPQPTCTVGGQLEYNGDQWRSMEINGVQWSPNGVQMESKWSPNFQWRWGQICVPHTPNMITLSYVFDVSQAICAEQLRPESFGGSLMIICFTSNPERRLENALEQRSFVLCVT